MKLSSESSSFRHEAVDIRAFTLIELLTVLAVILVLAGLLIAALPYLQRKPMVERTKGEIASMEMALANYLTDKGAYPQNANSADGAKILYQALTGDGNDRLVSTGGQPSNGQSGRQGKVYLETNSGKMVNQGAWELVDAWAFPYQYFTGTASHNPATFDLYSTGGQGSNPAGEGKWVTNWR